MKVDIEGHDTFVAKELFFSEKKPLFVSFETSQRDFADIFAWLHLSGYSKYQLVNQAFQPGRAKPSPSHEGKSIDFSFSPFSSGLFGEDLPTNKWLTYVEALERYLKYRELKNLDRDELAVGWLDLHARLK